MLWNKHGHKNSKFFPEENYLVMHLFMGIWPKAAHQGLCFYVACGSSTVVVLVARILLPHGHKVTEWFLTQWE